MLPIMVDGMTTESFRDDPARRLVAAKIKERGLDMAGLSRETVTRTLTRFRREGLVEQHGPRIILPRPAAMAARYG